jgi:hypothetical protein
MTLEKARELLEVQANFSGAYNRNTCHLILTEIYTDQGQHSCDALIEEFDLDTQFDIKKGLNYSKDLA